MSLRKTCNVNTFLISTLMLEKLHGSPIPLNGDITFIGNQFKKSRLISFFLWLLLFQNIGLADLNAEDFIKVMYSDLFYNELDGDCNNGEIFEEDELCREYSLCIKLVVGIKFRELTY